MKLQRNEYIKKKKKDKKKSMSIDFEIFQKLTQAGLYVLTFFGYF